ncbi:MAG: hypothetical protein VX757_09705, partial [Planctomycetota bacterium]|nr:hypothetical protein [Planctomycetota bacterium]
YRNAKIPAEGKTHLKLTASHHPHGDWQLRILVNGDVVKDQVVNSKSVDREWLDTSVDLSEYAGETVLVVIENRANNWANEWAYWNSIEISRE